MNFNSFNTFGHWGVFETQEEKQIREQQEKEQKQQRKSQQQETESYEHTSKNREMENNEIDLLVTSLGLTSLVNEIGEDKNKEDVLKANDEKILEIVLESDEENEKESIDPTNLSEKKEEKEKDVKKDENPFIQPEPVEIENPLPLSILKRRSLPLIDYLCQLHNCAFKELHVLFYNIEKRREIILHLQNQVQLRTSHLLPYKNFVIRCNDFTVHPASIVPAMGGYLNITVRGYYYVKHGIKLRHPYLPCLIEFGGGHHRSYYPLEVICKVNMNIENCTCVFRLLPGIQRFSSENFLKMARNGINTEYNPKRFHSIIMRIRHKHNRTTAALIFQSSKVVLTGVPNVKLARRMALIVLKRIEFSIKETNILKFSKLGIISLKVTNIVSSYRSMNRVAIELIYQKFRKRHKYDKLFEKITKVSYDPTIFPALRFKMKDDKFKREASCLIYISGRVILTGINSTKQKNYLFDNIILPLLVKYPRL
uniref:Uncharacterized protein n=3 Tax=Meloidogyne TaxID=189290 RepID=A0A6V7TSW5_MELEN|nr:unnamed protein product [Meloidogyne enterolobii]